ncbi:MAG: hypothetical protein ABH859_06155 [Pseudomonadota bacterium]
MNSNLNIIATIVSLLASAAGCDFVATGLGQSNSDADQVTDADDAGPGDADQPSDADDVGPIDGGDGGDADVDDVDADMDGDADSDRDSDADVDEVERFLADLRHPTDSADHSISRLFVVADNLRVPAEAAGANYTIFYSTQANTEIPELRHELPAFQCQDSTRIARLCAVLDSSQYEAERLVGDPGWNGASFDFNIRACLGDDCTIHTDTWLVNTHALAIYNFNGNTNDSSGNGYHGSIDSLPSFVTSGADCNGVIMTNLLNQAACFAGGSRIVVEDASRFNPTVNTLSFELGFMPFVASSGGGVFDTMNDSLGFYLTINRLGTELGWINNGLPGRTFPTIVENFSHVQFSESGISANESTNELVIGANRESAIYNGHISGLIDFFSIYDEALTHEDELQNRCGRLLAIAIANSIPEPITLDDSCF